MNIIIKFLLVFLTLVLIPLICFAAVDSKIKFNNKTYTLSNPDTKTDRHIYLLKDENIGNWNSQIYKEFIKNTSNKTEAAAEFAYQIQKENPKAVVLVYPEAATVGYITFPSTKNFYEYNAVVFKNSNDGLEKLGFAKRFYADKNGGAEGARTAAILFAEKNNKKFMEMVNKQLR